MKYKEPVICLFIVLIIVGGAFFIRDNTYVPEPVDSIYDVQNQNWMSNAKMMAKECPKILDDMDRYSGDIVQRCLSYP